MKISLTIFNIIIVGLLVSSCYAKEEKILLPPIQTDIVQVGDTNIEYFSQGNGDVIVLLSGRGLDVGYLEELAGKLADAGYQAIRVNRRGAGKSTGSLSNISYHTHASDVANVIRALHIKQANISGHALGGRIARVFAADYPELTSSVILMPASGKVKGDSAEAKATSKLFVPGATNDEIMNGMQYMVGDPAESERVWGIIQSSSLADRPLTLKSEATNNTPIEDWWAPQGTSPYLAIQGLKDTSAPPQNAQLLKQELGDRVTIVELPEAGHLAPVEYPDEVVSSIVSFLENVD